MTTRGFEFGLIVVLGGSLGGCMVGPKYHRPQVPVPARYKELQGWTPATPADAAPKGEWWLGFHDPLIDELEPRVAVSNQTVRQSYANYREALAEIKVARSQLFPSIGLSGSATRSGGASGAPSGSALPSQPSITAASFEGDATWSPDLWGSVRHLIEENTATAQADEAIFANATLSEQTLLASTIIELRATDAGIDLERATVAAYRQALRVTENQGVAGITSAPPSAVITARVALETAKAGLISMGVARAQYAHAIAVLVGENPENLDIEHDGRMPALPVIPVGMPSTLLQRRPDIASAERTVAAQNAAVGIAVAAFYPSVSLSASGGFAQAPLSGLLHAANHVWSFGANSAETVFDFGERHAVVEAARAAYESSVANYRSTVLNAFADVENDLSGLRVLAAQAGMLKIAVRDAVRGTRIALAEFEAGTVDYTTVAAAQEIQLIDQQSALSVQAGRLLAAVSLIGDLGGGWSDAQLQGPVRSKPQTARPR